MKTNDEQVRKGNLIYMKGKTKPLPQIAAEDIIDLIKSNRLEPGDRLQNEYELAKLLNVGRSTVREAIRILVSRNILEVRQGAGYFCVLQKWNPGGSPGVGI